MQMSSSCFLPTFKRPLIHTGTVVRKTKKPETRFRRQSSNMQTRNVRRQTSARSNAAKLSNYSADSAASLSSARVITPLARYGF
jgi:hypothetical protein